MKSREDEHQDPIKFSKEGDVFSETALRQLCKSLTKTIPRDEAEINEHTLFHLQSLCQGLLQTANSTKLSFAHGAAALNALCGFIEQCVASSVLELWDLCVSSSTWITAFDIFLERSERHNPKSARRLLLTLTDTVNKHAPRDAKLLLIGYAVSRATRAICGQHDIASVKPAIQALEHFVTVGIAAVDEVIRYAVEVFRDPLATTEGELGSPALWETDIVGFQRKAVERFALSVLEWVQYPDCAPAAGRFICTFFRLLNSEKNDRTVSNETTPLWIHPVKQAINHNPELLEVFELYVLPGLLKPSPADTRAFLNTLPLKNIAAGKVEPNCVADIRLCILIARVAADWKPGNGIVEENGDNFASDIANFGDQDGGEEEKSPLINSEALGSGLLEQPSAGVRLAALSLLISSSVTSRPLNQRVLDKLRLCLPYFHIEVNPKARNEFIALMKKLCLRIQGAIMSFLRAEQTSFKSSLEESSTSKPESVSNVQDTRDPREKLLRSHIAFRKWYLLFILHQLQPTASYQSHITALKILHPLLERELASRITLSKTSHEYFNALDETLPRDVYYRPLCDLLLNPFEDVRQWAALVFELRYQKDPRALWPSTGGIAEVEFYNVEQNKNCITASQAIAGVLAIAEKRATKTGRVDHADGVGRLYELLYSTSRVISKPAAWHHSSFLIVERLISIMEEEVAIANGDLLQAVGNASLHGHLIALRHIASRPDYYAILERSTKNGLQRWREFTERLIKVCQTVWDAVRQMLCYDAPESHGIDEEADDVDLGTKDALSFSWRALKESSSLLHTIIINKGYGPPSSDNKMLWSEDYDAIGRLSLDQLATLRHRGAFSTVSQTFSACCIACAGSSDLKVSSLIQTWYKNAFRIMEQNASMLTRRSAGIPAMVTGILAAYAGHEFFDDAMLDLQIVAEGLIEELGPVNARIPQVHALNCLKDIFTDARFGPNTEVHVADAIDIAASCLENPIWAIRNCGLMLFKAIIRRLNGGTDNASTKVTSCYRRSSNLIYERYPNLPSLVLRLLCSEPSSTTRSDNVPQDECLSVIHAHKVFPAMEILEWSGLPSECGESILAALWYYMEYHDWAIREKAAKSLSYVLDVTDFISNAEKLLSPDWPSQNALHGRLLCLQHLLSRNDVPPGIYKSLILLMNARCKGMAVLNNCPITAAAYLNILADILIIVSQQRNPVAQSLSDQIKLMSRTLLAHARTTDEDPALALRTRALKRFLSLSTYLESVEKPLDQLSRSDTDSMMVVDKARQNMSDENFLAVLRLTPPVCLWCQPEIMQGVGKSSPELPNSIRQANFELAVGGYDLGLSYSKLQKVEFKQRVSTWVRRLFISGSEKSELLTRVAAAYSLRGFFDGFRDAADREPRLVPTLLEPYVVLYDTLVDDDENIRDQGANTVSSLLSTYTKTGLSLSPPAAKCRLLGFLTDQYRGSTALFVEAVRKMTGLPSMYSTTSLTYGSSDREDDFGTTALHLRPVAEQSMEAQRNQIAIFVEEKQNLYVDAVSEANEWTNVLLKIAAEVWEPAVVSNWQSWTVNGLAYFLDFYKDKYDVGLAYLSDFWQDDYEIEALSPTSIPELYTLFIRVILSAKVLMTRSTSTSSEEKARKLECRVLLEKLLELGKHKQLHGLLLDRINSILADVAPPTEQL